MFRTGRSGSVGANRTSKVLCKIYLSRTSPVGARSIDETTHNFFCRSHKHRRLSRVQRERERERWGEQGGTSTLMRSYDMIMRPIHGIMYIGSCMIIWRDKAALSRHKLNRFSPLSVSLLFAVPLSRLYRSSTHPLPL